MALLFVELFNFFPIVLFNLLPEKSYLMKILLELSKNSFLLFENTNPEVPSPDTRILYSTAVT